MELIGTLILVMIAGMIAIPVAWSLDTIRNDVKAIRKLLENGRREDE